jgi:hypothetical protein
MTQERLIWQGQKQEKTRDAKKLEISISGLRTSIRTELNPHVLISSLNHELITEQAFELADKLIRYKELCAQVEAINNSLGTD